MDDESETRTLLDKKNKNVLTKNLVGFWLLGLANNFGYVVMLSTAHDILTPSNSSNTTPVNRTGHLVENCNPIGTGAVLLADILPALLIKILAPMLLQRIAYIFRVCAVVTFSVSSYILVSFGGSNHIYIGLLGVVFASASCGLGETTFLGLISHFDKNVLSTWSSGTGAAGLLGSMSYALLTSIGIPPNITLLIMLVIPCIMAISYFFILVSPSPGLLKAFTIHHTSHTSHTAHTSGGGSMGGGDDLRGSSGDLRGSGSFGGSGGFVMDDSGGNDVYGGGRGGLGGSGMATEKPSLENIPHVIGDTSFEADNSINLHVIKRFVEDERSAVQKFKALAPLLKYMLPLFLVFLIEYIINQTLFELIIFDNIWLGVPLQYRWYLVMYQTGVFLSRSSVNLVHIPLTWLFPIIQLVIFIILFLQIFYLYIFSIFIVFFLIIIEGMISGGAYVNTFYSILHKIDSRDRELGMTVTCISDSLGITSAALISIKLHNFLCLL